MRFRRRKDAPEPEEPVSRNTYRCSTCGINWPYLTSFQTCPWPGCGEPTQAINLREHPTDTVLTVAAARATLTALGVALDQPDIEPLGKSHRKQLRADLERWATHAPDWMRR